MVARALRPQLGSIRLASIGPVTLSPAQINKMNDRHQMARLRKLKGAQFWAAHETRIKFLKARIKAAQQRVLRGHRVEKSTVSAAAGRPRVLRHAA